REAFLPRTAGVLLPDPRPEHREPPGQRHRHLVPLGDLLHHAGAEAGGRGHHRRCGCLRPVAGQGGDPGGAGRRFLGGRARAPGLPAEVPGGVYLPLRATRLETATTTMMGSDIDFGEPGDGVLRVRVRGLRDLDHTIDYWEAILAEVARKRPRG